MNKIKEKTQTPFQNLLVGLFIFLLYVRPYEVLTFLIPLQLTRVFMVLAMLGCLMKGFNARLNKRPLARESSVKWFLAIQFMTLFSIAFSIWRSNTFSRFKETNMRIVITYFVLSSLVYSRKQLLFFVNVIYFSVCCFAARMLWAYQSGQYIFDFGVKRVVGVGSLGSNDPNDGALILAMAIPIGLFYLYTQKGMKRIIYAGMFGVVVMALIYTGSRGGMLGVALGLLTFFWFLYRKQKGKFFGMILLVSVLAVLFVPGEYKGRFMTMFNDQDYSHTDEQHGRVAIWKRSLQAIIARPIGYGGGNSMMAEGAQKQEEGIVGHWMVCHNSYLQMGVELGVIGLILYLMFLRSGFSNAIYTMKQAAKNKDKEYEILSCALMGGIAAFMISGFFLSQAYNWNTYIYIVLTMGLRRTINVNNKS